MDSYARSLLTGGKWDATQDPSVKTLNLSTSGMILTLIVNVVIFVLLLGGIYSIIFYSLTGLFSCSLTHSVFETYRFYKQIFLKRYQNRYINSMRVPHKPPNHLFGWFIALW